MPRPTPEERSELAIEMIEKIREEDDTARKAVESLEKLELQGPEIQCGTVEGVEAAVQATQAAQAAVQTVSQTVAKQSANFINAISGLDKDNLQKVNEQLRQLWKADNLGVQGNGLNPGIPAEKAVMEKYEAMNAALEKKKAELAGKGPLCSNPRPGGPGGGSRKRKRSKKRKRKGNKTRKNAQNNNNNNTTRRRKKTARRRRTKRA
jgi:hypothetical protein